MKSLLKQLIVAMLTFEAKLVLKKYNPTIIAVTGSVGKTSTKDAIASVLSVVVAPSALRKSAKSFNSEIGVPLTILGLENAWSSPVGWMSNLFRGLELFLFDQSYPKILVLEVGADKPGDIKRVTEWLRPDVAVVTSLPLRPVHVENFASAEDVRREKAYLVERLKPHGVFVGNADDPAVVALRTKTSARFVSYGFNEDAVVRATHPQVFYEEAPDGKKVPKGMTFRVDKDGGSFPMRIYGTVGQQIISSALAGLAVGFARGQNMVVMSEGLAHMECPPGRMHVIEGINESVIIDDSYNASPIAVKAALATLYELDARGRKIALLGDMLELGEYSEEEHRAIGAGAARVVNMLVTVGKRAKWIAEAAQKAKLPASRIKSFDTSEEAGEWLRGEIAPGDVVLAKGSQGSGENTIRMERAVKLLMANPEDASKLLVRQEAEWQQR